VMTKYGSWKSACTDRRPMLEYKDALFIFYCDDCFSISKQQIFSHALNYYVGLFVLCSNYRQYMALNFCATVSVFIYLLELAAGEAVCCKMG